MSGGEIRISGTLAAEDYVEAAQEITPPRQRCG
jgi:hypothetical protein